MVISSVLSMVRRRIATIAKNVGCMMRTRVIKLVISSVLTVEIWSLP